MGLVVHCRHVCIEQYLYPGELLSQPRPAPKLSNDTSQGLHVLVGAKYINTMIGSGDPGVSCQTVSFGIIMALISWICSLPRTFDMLSKLGTASAFFTFISVILATIFAAIQSEPAGFTTELGAPLVTAIPIAGTSFVSGLNAFLNISYTFIGQITLPSFIAEMKEPRDFPKALWACTILEILVFSIVGAVIYAYVGNQYMTAPAFGSLEELYKKVSTAHGISASGHLLSISDLLLFHDSNLDLLGCAVCFSFGPLHLLPHLPELASQE